MTITSKQLVIPHYSVTKIHISTEQFYLHCVSKTYHLWLAITLTYVNGFWYFFRRNVTDKASNQKTLYYATSNNLCLCTTWQNPKIRKLHFSLKMHGVCNPAYSCACPRPRKIGRVAAKRASGAKMGGIDGSALLIGPEAKHHLISYFLSHTCAKNCHSRIVYVTIIASQRWDVFKIRTV